MGEIPVPVQIAVELAGVAPNQEARFTYTPAVLRVHALDSVYWQCADPFVVHFVRTTPFAHVDFHGGPAPTTPEGFRHGVLPGSYHYVVAVAREGRVYVDGGCPEIIIDT